MESHVYTGCSVQYNCTVIHLNYGIIQSPAYGQTYLMNLSFSGSLPLAQRALAAHYSQLKEYPFEPKKWNATSGIIRQ